MLVLLLLVNKNLPTNKGQQTIRISKKAIKPNGMGKIATVQDLHLQHKGRMSDKQNDAGVHNNTLYPGE